ncbi:PREDICTED: nuclear export mediator factor NEMF homolog [Nicrophorus vespilloides]|uniref:Nuclear export mediator factor NEMF homolog n=1 Tax=Nicrophorus vespilloides TaxID=110193 RepID=A0ABM1MQI7_NICVS|nr:PREDICTED: nuclear export mediator factor NEMF homolog [Nicrophorus vespilloides]XP_017776837.1 PREDICTED: nuclear export mediator factor NEMF homolog [Nicrophorus vespilloides]
MKLRFNTYDIICSIAELQKLIGMRVNNVYDIDNKTYLIRLQKTEAKFVLLLESGNRFHTTNYEWPKNMAPSGFSMKLRKHLKNKRLESLKQLGCDRIVDLQFGSGEAAYHVILELFDKGNIVLTDFEWTILNVLRPHTEGDKVRFAVREKYPQDRARELSAPTVEEIQQILAGAKPGDSLKKWLMPNFEFGPALIEHVFLKYGFANSTKIGKDFNVEDDVVKLHKALSEAHHLMTNVDTSKGYIIQKKEERPNTAKDAEKEYFFANQEFHPLLYAQHTEHTYQEYETFNEAVDEFFSTLQGQKIDMKSLQQEREAVKKLENVKRDHDQRLVALEKTQESDKVKAELITKNQQLVESAILAIQSALANQMAWADIETLVKEAAAQGDPVAKQIKQLKLNTNHISLLLADPYPEENTEPIPLVIDIDLALSAFANARRYYDQKRSAAKKQQKTIESQSKALKSAEKKTKQVLKEMQTTTNINKARKVYWFEKFFWFISSENYLIIAGRDQGQNELIVKRYMRPTDIYVHADIHGASSVVIKNPSGKPVPPKTLNEAGTMAICYSVAWEAKVLTNAYWVFGEQVSKTAPTGEYLTTGSFMVRGKKNFLPPSHLILGLGFLFRLEDGSIERHKDERKVIGNEEELEEIKEDSKDEEIVISEDSGDSSDEKTEQEAKLGDIKEEDDEEESDSEESAFPDTKIKITHTEGTKINIVTETTSGFQAPKDKLDIEERMEKSKQRSRTASETSTKSKSSVQEQRQQKEKKEQTQQAKRGQRSKLKKIKEKYGDQDEEERQLRMTILQSAGPISKKNKKNSKDSQANKNKQNEKGPRQPRPNVEQHFDVEDEPVVQADVDMIDALTGIPTTEDELLFAVPVVAPYNTLSQYKFKVKLTPGTSKRGKASKTAVNMFLHEKTITQRERDLLKAVKDDVMAKNLPGKVKLSAPRLQALRK